MRLHQRAFTLVEVMIALAILGMGLVILVKSVAGNISAANEAFYIGVATDLARGKMYDLEEKLLDEGFQENVQEEDGDFSDEGWARITWKAVIEPAELPSFEKLMGLEQGSGSGSGSGSGDGSGSGEPDGEALDKFQSSALGGMLSMFGGGGGGGGSPDSAGEAKSGAFIQGQYTLIQQVLKASIRKISLTVAWDTGLRKEEMKVILYVTDPAGMQKTLGALGI